MNDNILKSWLHKLEKNILKNLLIWAKEKVVLLVNSENNLDLNIELQEKSELNLFIIISSNWDNRIRINQNNSFSRLNIGVLNLSNNDKISLDLKNIINSNDCETKINILGLCWDWEINISSWITIEKTSEKCSWELNQENIFLWANGKIIWIPGLDIRTNKAKANHSLKIERINPEELFYLESRGIDKQNATHIMLASKINNLFSWIPEEYNYFFEDKIDNSLTK